MVLISPWKGVLKLASLEGQPEMLSPYLTEPIHYDTDHARYRKIFVQPVPIVRKYVGGRHAFLPTFAFCWKDYVGL